MMKLDEVVSLFEKPTRAGSGYNVKCPCHDDKKASLSINEGSSRGKAGIFLYCQAGCANDIILSAVGLTYADISAGDKDGYTPAPRPQAQKSIEPKKPAPKKIYNQLLKTWNYLDTDGSPVFDIMRFHCKWDDGEETTKDFKVKYWDDNGKEIWKKPLSIVPYNLPDILQNDIIYIVEGEKDADTLISHGLCGTTAPFGAGKWPDDKIFNEYFEGKEIIIFPDNDPPGEKHGDQVAETIQFYCKNTKIKIINLPGNIEKGDVTDWLGSGHSILEMDEIVAATPYIDEKKTDGDTINEGFECTDMGNSERFLRQHSKDLRYCVEYKSWLTWDEKNWNIDNLGAVNQLAKKTALSIKDEAANAINDKQSKRIYKHAISTQGEGKLKAMVSLSKTAPEVSISVEKIDNDPEYIMCKNGIINLQTMTLEAFTRDRIFTKTINANFNKKAECPRWEQFLLETFQDNIDVVLYIQRAMGYSLTGSTSEHAIFFLYGTGENGKGVFLNTLEKLFGNYAKTVNADLLTAKSNDNIKLGEIGALKGIRLAISAESDQGARLNEATVKSLTSDDTLVGRFLYADAFNFKPTHKLWFATNYLPNIKGMDQGIWRRIKKIDFKNKLTEGQKDTNLQKKLEQEFDGILQWILSGLNMYNAIGLAEPEYIKNAVKEYQDEMDTIGTFLDEVCDFENTERETIFKTLYKSYEEWCENNGERYPLSQKMLGIRLRERGLEAVKRSGGKRAFKGIGIKDSIFGG